jgi:restriction endonuclease Mrr
MGSLLPESEYELPILRVLADHDGRAPAREVIAAVGKIVSAKLTALDREELPNGGKRWENRVQFTRLRLKERGLIESGSPRGLWELSDAGRELLSQSGRS